MFLRVFSIFVLVFLLAGITAHALKIKSATVRLPPHTTFEVPPTIKVNFGQDGYHHFYFNDAAFPFRLRIKDFYGAHFDYFVSDPLQLSQLVIHDSIIKTPHANPLFIDALPRLCPLTSWDNQNHRFVYHAGQDLINSRPHAQLFDPDYKKNPAQQHLLDKFDDHNVLTLKRVRLTYDFEDNTILDYQGPHFITGKSQLVYEGEGGFYANIHFAVVPFDARVLKLDRQKLLNFAQGKLANIDRLDLQPRLRAHSLIPGPYLSKDRVYTMCEWGDTAFQAPVQELYYNELALWDWDLDAQKIILIIWEGDEEDWLIQNEVLDPFYLTDDVVGVFVIDRSKTTQPLVIKNDARNFEIEVQTR